MAASLHQIARAGALEEGEEFFRVATDSRGEQAANALDGMQRTPLHLACWAGKAGMIDLLLKHRADCMAEAQDGFTPLHFCSQAGCAEGCRLLLGAGAKVDAKLRKTKKTPLHFAAGKGHVEAVRVLMQAGADVAAETSKGQTPLLLANKAEVKAALAGDPPPAGDAAAAAAAGYGPGTKTVAEAAAAGGLNQDQAGALATGGSAREGKSGKEHGGENDGADGTTTPTAAAEVSSFGGSQKAEGPSGGRGGSVAEAGGVGGDRVGSLAERRRKKRKLAKAAAAAAGGNGAVNLSHLGVDGDDAV
ncbi:unnamed protein product [Ectocarpus sp. CCAP 1310/34]|nr:unnamed protein product [Ectocarpus sp. CCAP 1310/34]